jgi:RHS repeat-associated protein
MPGQYYDQQTNLSYNYYRDYDPQTGRYIQSDPIGLGSGINTYGYVGGNPVWAYDKFGLAKVKPRNRMPSSHPRIAEVEERLAFVRMYLHVRATNCPGEGSELLDLFNTWTVYVDSEKGSSDPQDGETVADTFGDRRVTILYINAEITTQLLAHELFHLTAANMRTKSANGNRETFSLVPHDKRSWEIPAIDFGNKFLDCKCSR